MQAYVYGESQAKAAGLPLGFTEFQLVLKEAGLNLDVRVRRASAGLLRFRGKSGTPPPTCNRASVNGCLCGGLFSSCLL